VCKSNCYDPTQGVDTPSSVSSRSDDGTNYTEEFHLVKRDGQTVNAHNVDEEVAFISAPLGEAVGRDFVYDNTAGTGQTVYIVDTGAGLGNIDVSFLIQKAVKVWLKDHIGVWEIRYSEQKIPSSHRCNSKRWPAK
jgi:hypothetical protein